MSMENSTLYENSYSAYTQSAKKSTSEVRDAEKLLKCRKRKKWMLL